MNIIVCVKEVADPEAPADSFRLDSDKKVLEASPKVLKVLNPFDEHAVEAALRIKDKREAHVTIISLGEKMDRVVAKKPLLMGADKLVLLEDEAFADSDSWSTAYALVAAIKKIGAFDLILCGRQATDWNAGQTGLGIAEVLGLPSVNVARKIEILNGKARIERVTADGYDAMEVTLPALITVSNELGLPRYPAVQNIRIVNQIDPTVWKPQDIGMEPTQLGSQGRRLALRALYQPVSERACEIIEGDTPQEAAENLALKLRAEKIV